MTKKKHSYLVYDRRKESIRTGIGTIEICIYLSPGVRKYIPVGKATPEQWEEMAQSSQIQSQLKHYEMIIQAMDILHEPMTIENFLLNLERAQNPREPGDRVLFNGHDQRQSYPGYVEMSLERENLRPNSIKGFMVLLRALKESGILNTFADLTPAKIYAFDEWFRQHPPKSDYTMKGYHKKNHKYILQLYRKEMIPSDPYMHVKFNRGSNKERNPLTEEELNRIIDAKFSGYLERARDLFVFMAFTSLSYCDMKAFDFATMTEQHDDIYYIDGSRLKTGSNFYTPILPPAMDVLEKYDYKLPVISNQKINMYSHVIEAQLKISKPITCHVARHTFATLMLTYGVPMEQVQRMLGHKNLTTTQIYGKILKKTIETCVKKKLPRLFKKRKKK
jgi:site-specific recombinase XerD